MPKVGRIVTDPRTGARCRVTLDRGDKLIVRHEKGGSGAGLLTIEVSKLMGLSSERIFAINVDSPAGASVLAWLTRGAEPGSFAATPLGAAIAFAQDAGTLAELRTRCAVLMATR